MIEIVLNMLMLFTKGEQTSRSEKQAPNFLIFDKILEFNTLIFLLKHDEHRPYVT